MPIPRKRRPRPIDQLEALLPDKERWDSFQHVWRRLEAGGRADLEAVTRILYFAWFHAELDRIAKEGQNRGDLKERSQRIRHKLAELGNEIVAFVDDLPRFARLAALRARPVRWDAKTIAWGEAILSDADPSPSHVDAPKKPGILTVPPDTQTIRLDPIGKAFHALRVSLEAALDQFETPLVRTRGQQPHPWKKMAIQELHAAGATKEQADELLRAMGLKRSEAARQTIRLR